MKHISNDDESIIGQIYQQTGVWGLHREYFLLGVRRRLIKAAITAISSGKHAYGEPYPMIQPLTSYEAQQELETMKNNAPSVSQKSRPLHPLP